MNYRVIRKRWRRFYREHREILDLVGYFVGALSIFVTLLLFYFLGILLGG